MEFKHTQLENGLTVIAEVIPQARSLAVGFFTRTGARDETPEIAGTSHFLEHMMFKGTPKRSALEVNLEFDNMGAKYNAFTSEENTVYYAAVLPEYQNAILDLWADLMRPALRDDDFNTEKGVICEEIAMYKDLPHFDVMDRCRALHFGDHACGNSVLGTTESIQALTSKQMRDYFARRYAPDNMVLACTGNVNWEKLIEQAQLLCGSWQPSGPQRELSHFAGTGKAQAVKSEIIQREHICLMTPAPSSQSPQRYAASLLANIIGDDTGSRFYWDLVDNALTDSADLEYDALDGTGVYYTYISCDPVKSEKVIEVVRNCFDKIRREGVTAEELATAKNKISATVTLSGEVPMGRLVPLGFGWVYRQEYRTLAEELETLFAITLDDINDLIKAYPLELVTAVGLGPCEQISGI